MTLRFESSEVRDLIFAWFAVASVFIIAFSDPLDDPAGMLVWMIPAVFFVGLGVVVHELAHKYVGTLYGYHAVFIANRAFTIISVIAALAGLIILAPGAVHIMPAPPRRETAMIALAGPLSNLAICIACILFGLLIPLFAFGALINAYLAVFNMLPIPGLDGHKVLSYSKPLAFGTLIVSAGLLAGSYMIFIS